LAPVEASTFAERGIYLISETYQHQHLVVQAANHILEGSVLGEGYANGPRRIDYWVELQAEQGRPMRLEKLVTTYSSRDLELQPILKSKEVLLAQAASHSRRAVEQGYQRAVQEHTAAW